MSYSKEHQKKFEAYLSEKGLHASSQRDLILKEFFRGHRHLTIEEWLAKVRPVAPQVGYATVYRTLKLLEECGLAARREFRGQVRFEPVSDHHHDHLICTKCGKIIEFENDKIEVLQLSVARKYKFSLKSHKMELYGHCSRCSHR